MSLRAQTCTSDLLAHLAEGCELAKHSILYFEGCRCRQAQQFPELVLVAWQHSSIFPSLGAFCCLCKQGHEACSLAECFMGLRCMSEQDDTEVQAHRPPKAVTVEDSFRSCTSLEAAGYVLKVLAPDLLLRLQEELEARLPACPVLHVADPEAHP